MLSAFKIFWEFRVKLKDKTRRLKKVLSNFINSKRLAFLSLNIFEWVWTIYIILSMLHLLHPLQGANRLLLPWVSGHLHLGLLHGAHHALLVTISRILTGELRRISIETRHGPVAPYLALSKLVSNHLTWSSSVQLTWWLVLVNVWIAGPHVLIGLHICVHKEKSIT